MLGFSMKRALGSVGSRIFISKRLLPGIQHQSTTTTEVEAPKCKALSPLSPEEEALVKRFKSPQQVEAVEELEKHLTNLEECREIFYGPDRDFENFPTPKLREHNPPMKYKVIPQSWFDLLYEKTGVTGPYFMATGLGLYLFSKELFLMDPHMFEVLSVTGVVSYLFYKAEQKGVNKYLDNCSDRHQEAVYYRPLRMSKDLIEKAIAHYTAEIDYMKEENFIDDVYEENVGLMLEAEYRRRLDEVHQETKRRLDYQLELQNTKRRFEQQHMVNWISSSVLKSITPQLEKESITSCINTLKSLAKTAQASA